MVLHTPLLFDSDGDVHQKTHQTLIKFKDKHVFCEALGTKPLHINLTSLNPSDHELQSFYDEGHFPLENNLIIHSSDKDLNFETPELGYINVENHAIYLSRKASRQYRQGLSLQTLQHHYLSKEEYPSRNIDFFIPSFSDMLENIYPSIDEALYTLNNLEDTKAIAFHRRYAFKREKLDLIFLFMCSKSIGYIQKSNIHTLVVPNSTLHTKKQHDILQKLGFHHITG